MSHIVEENTKNVIFETIRVSTLTLGKDYGQKKFIDIDDGFFALEDRFWKVDVMYTFRP